MACERERESEREREGDKERERARQRQRECARERATDRQTERQTARQREGEREKEYLVNAGGSEEAVRLPVVQFPLHPRLRRGRLQVSRVSVSGALEYNEP